MYNALNEKAKINKRKRKKENTKKHILEKEYV
jgi:hypothetical protein